jgi:transcriptional regulator with XRE-family HTH domain
MAFPQDRRHMVGDRLAELREQKALTLRELEEASGVGADAISKIENGHRKPRPSTLRKLARALGVEAEDFFREPPVPLAKAPPSSTQPPLNGFEEERRDYGRHVWQRINLLDAAAEQWQRFADEGLYDLKKLDFELLKAVDRVYLGIVLNHGREAAAMKRASTDEERARLEQAERRLIDNNLEFWGRVENELAHEEVTYLEAVRAWRKESEQVSRSSRTA